MQNRFGSDTDPFELREPVAEDFLSSHDETIESPSWFELFQYDQYDWEDLTWKLSNKGPQAFRPIILTQGYFMIVSLHDYKLMKEHPDAAPKNWRVIIHRDPETGVIKAIYARRHGRRSLGEPKHILAHRELIGCLDSPDIVDHMNGYGLDNRRGTEKNPINLRYTGRDANGHNNLRRRPKDPGLPPGVERWGKHLFGGKYTIRKNGKPFAMRSPEKWEDPEMAAQWYQNELRKMYPNRGFAHNPTSVCYPDFPPLKQADEIGEIPF